MSGPARAKGVPGWKSGDRKRAKRHWSGHNESGHWGAIWRGDLYHKLGELKEAGDWYLAAWWQPVAHKRLVTLYEQRGKPEKPRAAYDRFVEGWKDADPELQGCIEKAHQRLDVLNQKTAAE